MTMVIPFSIWEANYTKLNALLPEITRPQMKENMQKTYIERKINSVKT